VAGTTASLRRAFRPATSAEEVTGALGFIGQVLAMDATSSSKSTQERLGWRPIQPGQSVKHGKKTPAQGPSSVVVAATRR
jgi:hypothetical protein